MDWYEPNKNNKISGKKKTRRIFGICIIALAIVSGTFYAFINPAVNENGVTDSFEIPSTSEEFFDTYFTTTDTDIANIKIETIENRPDFRLEFSDASEDDMTLSELYSVCSKSIVGIKGFMDGKTAYLWGTGVILSDDGLILTNTHVVEDCDRVNVLLFGDDEYEAKLVGADSISDLCVLKIEAENLSAATFGDSSKLCVGQDVCAIGNPLGDTFSLTLTNGIISAIDRGMTYNGHEMTLLQTNTALNEGNSGGALFNMQGQVVGITNMKMMSYYNSIEGIGFAIPSSTCKAVTDALIADGKVSGRTSIGITVGEIPDEAKEAYNLPSGLYVSDVSKGSDAEKQGIQKGDVITAFDGVECLTTSEVLKIKESLSVGDKMTLTVYRDGESFDVDITLMDTNDLYG